MKIHRVHLEGFGPYRGAETVDFDAFADDGIFLITGRTGAGKTSVLDAITYALFGRVPRYEGTAGEKVRSDHLEPTERCVVELDFSVAAGRFRVTRSPAFKRPKKRGEGLTDVKATFELARWVDDRWEVLEAKEGNADRHVSDVVPLTAEQFQQVILLAQGQFQEFLVAGSSERQALLSRLFDTSRFTAYSDDLSGRAKALRVVVAKGSTRAETQVASLATTAGVEVPAEVDATTGDGVAAWLDALRVAAEQERSDAAALERDAVAAFEAARTARLEAEQTLGRQQRLEHARAQARQLDERADQIAAQRTQVADARRARVAHEAWRSWHTASEALARATAARDTAVEQHAVLSGAPAEGSWEESGESGGAEVAPTLDELRAQEAELSALIAELRVAAALEARLPSLVQQVTAAENAVQEHARANETQRAQRETLRARIAVLEEEMAQVRLDLEAHEGDDLALAQSSDGLQAAERADEVRSGLARSQAEHLAAVSRHEETVAARSALVRRRYAEYAGVLARDLEAGEPCLVCGSTDHPAPAALADDHVDDAALDGADTAVSRAETALGAARDAVARAETLLSELVEVAGGRDVEAWRAEVVAAQARIAERAALQKQLAELTEERTHAVEREKQLTGVVDGAGEVEAGLVAAALTATAAHSEAVASVTAALGGAATVAERVAGVAGELDAVRTWVRAEAELATRVEVERAARGDRDAVLAEQGFADHDQARGALLDPDVLRVQEATISEYDRLSAVVESTLAQPDLQGLPDAPVDPTPLVDAAIVAEQAATAATQNAGAVKLRADRVFADSEALEESLSATDQVRQEYSVVNALAEVLRGQGQNERRIALEAFALAAELEEIVATANQRLLRMTAGRYEFRHDDSRAERGNQSGLALSVLDAHTGEARSPKSLSGGEKFQASLALALGLAEVVTARAGGIRLDTLFIDEGFGTLDPETLESTMATLDSLREGGRTVGLISHVGALKEAIPAQLFVDVTPGGWSTIRQE